MSNLSLWESVERTDPNYTKNFNRSGGFSGTSTNPTYLIKKATQVFGVVGIGWGWEVIKDEVMVGGLIQVGDNFCNELVHTIHLRLWYVINGEKASVEHFGATTFVGKNKYGVFTDEEAKKKSLTDALTKCLSMLGFSADIHMGKWDDNKYVNDRRNEVAAEKVNNALSMIKDELEKLTTEEDIKRLFALSVKSYEFANGSQPYNAVVEMCKKRIEAIK